jgi:hypothetical protein
MRFDWLPQALADFDEIIDYIAEENPDAAIQQGDEIDSQMPLCPTIPNWVVPVESKELANWS